MNAISLDVDMLSDIPARSLLALLEKHKEVKKFFKLCERTIKELPGLFALVEDMDISVSYDPSNGYIGFSFSGDGPKLGKIWGELRRCGYSCDTRPQKGDTSFGGIFKRNEYASILLYFSSTLCRRVQVGTQTVEQPIYETVCGEDLKEIEEIMF